MLDQRILSNKLEHHNTDHLKERGEEKGGKRPSTLRGQDWSVSQPGIANEKKKGGNF